LSEQEALEKLNLLSDWTEEPARNAAASIDDATDVVAPWEAVHAQTEMTKSVNFKLPIALYQKLKWLGDTTYNSSMTQIVVEEMTKATDRLLKERTVGK
jgi:hypothetical protein